MKLRGREITVLGGGVAGLSSALALARRGARVRVLEQAPAIAEVGAGLQIGPNGARVLQALGLGEALARAGIRAAGVALIDGLSGRPVLRMGLVRRGWEPGQFMLHRADLIAILERGARAAGVEIVTGARAVSVVPGAPVRIDLDSGWSTETGVLIGADGLRSVLRPLLNPELIPRFTGKVAWRAVIPQGAAAEPVAQVFMAPGRHLVSYPVRGGTKRNIAAFEERAEWAAEGWHERGRVEDFRKAFAMLRGDVPEWLAAVEEVHLWGLFRHPVAPRWQGGSCALIGDAAHPTLPFMAQGANMALEDAWVLARCLDEISDMDQALAAYQAARYGRVARIVATADANARIYHMGGVVRPVAQAVMRLGGALFPAIPLRRFDWIYRHDVTVGG